MQIENTDEIKISLGNVYKHKTLLDEARDTLQQAILDAAGVAVGDIVSYNARHAGRGLLVQGEIISAECDLHRLPLLYVRRCRKDGTLSRVHDFVREFEFIDDDGGDPIEPVGDA